MVTNPPIPYCTFTGFGEATHEAILALIGNLWRFCTNPNDYLFRLLGPLKLLKLPDELLLHLEHLTVPAASVVFFRESPYLSLAPALHGVPDPTTTLPENLKSLSLFVRDHICERGHTLRWLSDLFLPRTDKPFPTLQRVQLYFTNTPVKFRRILNHHASDASAFDSTLMETDGQRAITRIFQTHNVDLELFFVTREKPVFGSESIERIDIYDRSNYHRVCHKPSLNRVYATTQRRYAPNYRQIDSLRRNGNLDLE
jgi:hypothetical protein